MQWVRAWVAKRCIIRKGSNRLVVDFINLGFVIKLPIVHLLFVQKELKFFLHKGGYFRGWIGYDMDNGGVVGVKRLLFKGIADNWREFWFYAITRHLFAHPTYFSLFGLVNVQRRGDSPAVGSGDFARQVKCIIGEEEFHVDAHHFRLPNNFCVVNGRLRMVDYGSPNTRRVIREVGMCLYKNFKVD